MGAHRSPAGARQREASASRSATCLRHSAVADAVGGLEARQLSEAAIDPLKATHRASAALRASELREPAGSLLALMARFDAGRGSFAPLPCPAPSIRLAHEGKTELL